MADRTRLLALKNGWAPPLAWDDDTIDDPGAEPWRPTARVHLIDAIADAAALGLNADEVARQLGRHRDSLYQACRRAGELDLWQRLTERRAA